MNDINLNDALESYQQLQSSLHNENTGVFSSQWQPLFGYIKVYLNVETHQNIGFSELKKGLHDKYVSGWLSLQDKNTLIKNERFSDVIAINARESEVLQGELCLGNISWRFTRISEMGDEAQYHLVKTTEQIESQNEAGSQIYLAKPVAHLAQQKQNLCYHKYYRVTADGGVRPFHARLVKIENATAIGNHT